ncbi:PQQ-dependent sugar dehydrogenase [Porticoccus sp. W117]|uniref:PQQ-dependent sugar dehydrogenase n=1 Tax=Porticoccus sp. W117 TaxID=3054777 RepID=UPI0025952788|nr:PQQ-dependent sugar dehydrogenase [Porticoccus sp. W117]MDM3872279.1 PQQ-dependent sugar dehydrogenase [Porticoccus sp. W117]
MTLLVRFVLCLLFSSAAWAQYQVETVAEELNYPWSIAFLPGGDMLVTERGGQLRMIRDGRLLSQSISGVPKAHVQGQGGMLDVLLAEDFEQSGVVYLSYAHGDRKRKTLRIAKGKLVGMKLTDVEVIFSAEPWRDRAIHYGGRMVWLPDGTLLAANGDGGNHREQAQKLDNHYGKSIRLNPDGSVPKDNPYVGKPDVRPEIWSYGHRNPQAIVYDADSDSVYMHEHGPKGGDELNLVKPGKNYGWPAITYGIDYNGSIISPHTELPNMEQPLVYWVPSIAPAGMTQYKGSAFPQWQNNLFVAALKEQSVRRLTLDKGKVVDQEILFKELGARIRDVRTGPDGYLYLLTDSSSGKVLRVKPKK